MEYNYYKEKLKNSSLKDILFHLSDSYYLIERLNSNNFSIEKNREKIIINSIEDFSFNIELDTLNKTISPDLSKVNNIILKKLIKKIKEILLENKKNIEILLK